MQKGDFQMTRAQTRGHLGVTQARQVGAAGDSNERTREGKLRMRFGKASAGAIIAVAGLTAVGACSSSSSGGGGTTGGAGSVTFPGALGSIPAAATGTQKPGTITFALQPGAVPNFIFPVLDAADNSVYNNQTFEWEMWRPLYWTQKSVNPVIVPEMSLAELPTYTNGNKTVTIKMKDTYKWSDGQPVTAKDLEFDIDLIKAAVKENPGGWASYVKPHFPDDVVSMSTPDPMTLVINLSDTVNSTWFTQDILAYAGPTDPIPSHAWSKTSTNGPIIDFTNPANAKKIYDFLMQQNKAVSSYATNPLWQVVDGPYKLSQYNATTGGFTMVPNTTYGGPHVKNMSSFQGVPFTSPAAEFNALKAGSIDVGYVTQNNVPQLGTIKRLGYNTFGIPDFGLNFIPFNFEDTTNHFNKIAAQLYFRQAMAHLQDSDGYLKAIFFNAGDPAYGPVPKYPASPFLPDNASTNPYPFSIAQATSLLQSHGWKINAGGTDVCQNAGSGPTQCGAGIPAGTQLQFNLIYNSGSSVIPAMVQDLASKAKQAGINIQLSSSNFDYMIQHYNDAVGPANYNTWAMVDFGGESINPYPTSFGLFNTGGAGQIGNYSDPKADALIQASISGTDPNAVKAEGAYITQQVPALFQPVNDRIWAWKTSISGNPDSFGSLTQFYANPEFWYFTK